MYIKLTFRYLLSIAIVAVIVVLINITIIYLSLYSKNTNSLIKYDGNNKITSFVRNFEKYIDLDEDNRLYIDNNGKDLIDNSNSWVQILDENNKILVSSKSNSGLYEPAQYELDFNTSITESDVDVEWTTLMGESTPTENDQLSIAYVSISENGKDTIKIKISFVNGGIEIIEDALEKK